MHRIGLNQDGLCLGEQLAIFLPIFRPKPSPALLLRLFHPLAVDL